MKKSELKQIIKEEISNNLKEESEIITKWRQSFGGKPVDDVSMGDICEFYHQFRLKGVDKSFIFKELAKIPKLHVRG